MEQRLDTDKKKLGHASIKTTTIYKAISKMTTDKILIPLDNLVDKNNKEKLNDDSKTSKKIYIFDVISKLAASISWPF